MLSKKKTVNDPIHEIANLAIDIFNNKDDPKFVEKRITEIKQKYEKNDYIQWIFSDKSKLSFTKKDKSEWNEKYFDDLKIRFASGESSKSFIIHLAEVHNYLRKKKFFFFK